MLLLLYEQALSDTQAIYLKHPSRQHTSQSLQSTMDSTSRTQAIAAHRYSVIEGLESRVADKTITLLELKRELHYLGVVEYESLAHEALNLTRFPRGYLHHRIAQLQRNAPVRLEMPSRTEIAEAMRMTRAIGRQTKRTELNSTAAKWQAEAQDTAYQRAKKMAEECAREEQEEREHEERVRARQRRASMARLTDSYDMVEEDGGVEALSDADDEEDKMNEWAVVNDDGDVDEPTKV